MQQHEQGGESIENWHGEEHLILVNGPSDQSTFYPRRWHTTAPASYTDNTYKQISRTLETQLGERQYGRLEAFVRKFLRVVVKTMQFHIDLHTTYNVYLNFTVRG
ncbi:hypothetical protein ScPMuIL_011872 [Solemya velum]